MYHLFVTAAEGAWASNGTYVYPVSRFLEYTDSDIADSLRVLTPAHIEKLKTLPCVFAYEGNREDVRLGRLTEIKRDHKSRHITIEFELDERFSNIPFAAIKDVAGELDIRSWEMNRTHWAIKDVDLVGVLREANIIRPNVAETTLPVSAQDNPLPASEPSALSATNLHDFIRIVLSLTHGKSDVFYRGHSKQSYKLEPSLFRRDQRGNYLYRQVEDLLYRELLVSNSIDFDTDTYTLDRLIRMQHFSLPTRLLDITSNALIALFFACKANNGLYDNAEVMGEVVVFSIAREGIKYFDSDTASVIANLARLSNNDKVALKFDVEGIKLFNEQTPMRRLLHFVKEEKSFFEPRIEPKHLQSILCVKGKRSNDRISSQSGAFLLFGHEAVLDEAGADGISVVRISVTNKAEILRQLDGMNINESTVFPNIESSAKYIAEKFKFRVD
ncbi:FRG domain-containing protein [Paraburkholderia sp. BCC1885]|uniref:FRG domain-containing protein n=1 Tax=Paraburkholderia sp. BCC1885 TaxID=2562669 RepID=UPI0011838CFB|nr:FRG domain-containing protein [Paraburkholderia sp. BCC1885]